jgi:DNA-binding transcriptional regulator YiaG
MSHFGAHRETHHCSESVALGGSMSGMDATQTLLDEVRLSRTLPSPDAARLIRQQARVSQIRLAEAVGVDRTTVARWEAGTTRPTGQQRLRYAALLVELQQAIAVA